MRNFLDRYLPVFQAPDAPSGGGGGGGSPPSAAPAASGGSAPSTPVSTPPSPSAPEVPSSEAPESVDFSMIFGEVDPPSSPPETPEAPKPTDASAQPPKVEPAQPKALELDTPEGTKPAPTELPSTPAADVGARLDPYDPVALVGALRQNEEAAVSHIAETVFKLSEKDIEALENDVVGTVPKLLAKAVVQAQMNALQVVGKLFPAMAARHQAVTQKHGENESQFYRAWPQIEQGKHGALVNELGSLYRRMNPDAPLEKMIDDVGPLVMMRLGLPLTPRQQQAPQTPAVPANPMAGRPHQPSPFTPAAPLAGGPTPQPRAQLDHPVVSMFEPHDG